MKPRHFLHHPGATSWQALTYFNVYRFLVALLFIMLYWWGHLPEPLGQYDRTQFAICVHFYLLMSLAAGFFIHFRTPPYVIQVVGQICADIAVITLLMHASGGLESGFGMLLVIVVAGGALLSPGKIGILFAALAAIAVLGHEVYTQLHWLFPQPNYTHAGFLGITFFVTAFIGDVLASRVEESEALAEQRAIDLQNLSHLNEHIVRQMQSGIIVLDETLRIGLMNDSAKQLLGAEGETAGHNLEELSPSLAEAARAWLTGRGTASNPLVLTKRGVELQASFSRLKMENRVDLLIFLEDVATLRQRAQQMKLASLGRLTASIAHEVRNPLGAISHASQLLAESASLRTEDRRLTAIIDEQSRRVNSIVESIMSISRRNRTEPEVIELDRWLEGFRSEFAARLGVDIQDIELTVRERGLRARMDPDQLRQVLWNLCENGARYSRGKPLISLHCGVHPESLRPYIDVVDRGPGISGDAGDQLFEPFYTTESNGTGLGLYIARELCEANQATLNLMASSPRGCCFRINLSHPEKQHVLN